MHGGFSQIIDGTPYAMKVARAVWTYTKSEGIVRDEGALELAVYTGQTDNAQTLNDAISTMWSLAFSEMTFDATEVTQAYVDVMNASVPPAGYTLNSVPIPAKIVIPEGKTFDYAEIKHDVNDEYSVTTAVLEDGNWGEDLIVWMNTNMAYGWTQADNEVVYTYLIHWTDGSLYEYPVVFVDADL